MLTFNSIVKLKEFFLYIKERGYNIYIKGHPRLGVLKEFKDLFDIEIPMFVPSEFILYDNIEFALRIISSRLVYPSELKENQTFSLMNLLEFKISEDKIFYQNFLNEPSKEKVVFINDLDFLK